MNNPRNTHGYTMIELLVVLTIIGILTGAAAALATQSFRHMTRIAARNNAYAQFDVLWSSSLEHRRNYPQFPTSVLEIDYVPPMGSLWEAPVTEAAPGLGIDRAVRWVLRGKPGTPLEGRMCSQTIYTEGRDERLCAF